jgi:hypothetical protein
LDTLASRGTEAARLVGQVAAAYTREQLQERDAALALVTKLRDALRDAADGLVPAIGDPAVREVQRRARACLAAEEPR